MEDQQQVSLLPDGALFSKGVLGWDRYRHEYQLYRGLQTHTTPASSPAPDGTQLSRGFLDWDRYRHEYQV